MLDLTRTRNIDRSLCMPADGRLGLRSGSAKTENTDATGECLRDLRKKSNASNSDVFHKQRVLPCFPKMSHVCFGSLRDRLPSVTLIMEHAWHAATVVPAVFSLQIGCANKKIPALGSWDCGTS